MVNVRWTGLNELEKALLSLPKAAAQAEVEQDLLAAAAPITRDAASRAPRDKSSPHAADTIHAERIEAMTPDEVRVGIGPSPAGWYLRFSEFGTSKMAARPWLRPAFDGRLAEALSILRARVSARIQDTWARNTRRAA